jgi:membrane-associated phospholipid phosphatase
VRSRAPGFERTTATITSWGRIRENGHWSSDALAGALIGFHVGRAVVHINQKLRARVRLAPMVSQDARGLVMKASF